MISNENLVLFDDLISHKKPLSYHLQRLVLIVVAYNGSLLSEGKTPIILCSMFERLVIPALGYNNRVIFFIFY
jgi:hypothetical protein